MSSAWSQQQSLGAHVHGIAELLIAIEGQEVEIQLLSPANNILGFEHTPSSDKQWQQVSQAEGVLRDTKTLFSFQGAGCQASSAVIEMPFTLEQSTEQHQGHRDHVDHHHDHQHDHGDHTEVTAHYRFHCDTETPEGIQVRLFDQFPGIESIKLEWITESTQDAQTLSVDQSSVSFQ